VRKGLASPSAAVLRAALGAAAVHRVRRAATQAVDLCASPDAEVRLAAVQALVILDVRQAQARAAKCLDADPEPRVRAGCAMVLGDVGGPQAAAALTRARLREQDANVKFVVGESLSKLGLTPSP